MFINQCPLPIVFDGEILLPNGNAAPELIPQGTVVLLQCWSGFFFHGAETTMCVQGGRWSHPIGYCKPDSDAATTTTTTTTTTMTKTTTPVTTTATETTTTATNRLIKSSTEKYTQKYLTDELQVEVMKRKTPRPFNDTEGTRINNGIAKTSTANGISLTKCTFRRIVCTLPLVTNGRYFSNDQLVTNNYVLPGVEVKLVCDPGFAVTYGLDTSTCHLKGQWVTHFGHCQRVCGPLPRITNGIILKFPGGYGLGVERLIKCDQNYYLKGPSSIICTYNGTWSRSGECLKCKNEQASFS